jgi:RHS repeat-associated protein
VEEIVDGEARKVYGHGDHLISQRQLEGGLWTTVYYGYDAHSGVRLLTNEAGEVTDRYNYDAFGNFLLRTGTTNNNYLFRGEYSSQRFGWYYLRARHYNQSTGRFTSFDSASGVLSNPITLHKYLYADADPVNNVDPSGLISLATYPQQVAVGTAVIDGTIRTLVLLFAIAVGYSAATATAAAAAKELRCAVSAVVETISADVEAPEKCAKHRGRIQVQGKDLKDNFGTDTISRPWARTLPPHKSTGIYWLHEFELSLSRGQQSRRKDGFSEAAIWVLRSPLTGRPVSSKSFPIVKKEEDKAKFKDARVDIEIKKGFAFVGVGISPDL